MTAHDTVPATSSRQATPDEAYLAALAATLPGLLQVHRYSDHDLLTLQDEAAPGGGRGLGSS